MAKYVIELNPDGTKSLVIFTRKTGVKDITAVIKIDELDESTSDLLDKAYQKGFEDGKKQKVDDEVGHNKGKWKDIVEGIEYACGTCDKCGARIPMAYKYYKYCPHCGTKNEVEK